ncbi:MAG: DUF4363 family protein [Ruminococcus sp.]|nr:DUF4363 family protein [Ruminococcus sp.]
MKRIYASVFIIIFVIALDVYSHHVMLKEKNRLDSYLTGIQQYAQSEDTESAILEAEKLIQVWEHSRKKLAFFVNNRNLDEISDSITKIKPLLRSDSDEVSAEAEQIKQKLLRNHTRDLPYIYNIF